MPQFTVQEALTPKQNGGTNRGTIQVDRGNTDVHLWGSLITDDASAQTGWVLLHSFTEDDLKEVVLAPAMCISGSDSDVTVSVGTSAAWLIENR